MAASPTTPQVHLKRHKGLHDNDSRFVEEVIKVVSSLDGSSTMKLRVYSKFPTKFSMILCNPPKMTLNDISQIPMMNNNVISIQVDLNTSEIKIDAYKHKEGTKKRKHDIDLDERDIPINYDLTMVDTIDKQHVRGIFRNVLGMTYMEFNSEITLHATHYILRITDIELFDSAYIKELTEKYRAFIAKIVFDFPRKSLDIKIRRNDVPIFNIQAKKRKKLKLLK